MNTAHTAGPWIVKPFLTPNDEGDPLMVYEVIAGNMAERFDTVPTDDDGAYDETMQNVLAENAANAAFIAQACNSHDAMLNALKDIADALDLFTDKHIREAGLQIVLEQANAAIAQAEGGTP